MARRPSEEFAWYEGLAFALAAIANQLSSEFLAQWGPYFYSPTEGSGRLIFVPIAAVGIIFFVGRFLDAFIDPLAGVWSDQKRAPGVRRFLRISGRRRPFIFWGSILLTVTSIAFWYPPLPYPSTVNTIYGTAVHTLHLALFSLVLVPLLALGPEVARSQQARVRLGVWIAVGMIAGLAIAAVLPGILIEALDPARHTPDASGFSPAGYRRTAIIFAFTSLALFQFLVWVVKERHQEAKPNPAIRSAGDALAGVYATLRNSMFVKFLAAFFLFNIGFLATQRVLPNWAEVGLGGSESTVTQMMLPFIISALLTAFIVMPVAARFLSMKALLFISFLIIVIALPMMYPIAVLDLGMRTRFWLGALLFLVCGVAQGIQYVLLTPMIGEIIDLDEAATGQRREGAYNGMWGIANKGGQALSVVVSNICLSRFGNSVQDPDGIFLVGPVAAVFALMGLMVVWRYPVLTVTPVRSRET